MVHDKSTLGYPYATLNVGMHTGLDLPAITQRSQGFIRVYSPMPSHLVAPLPLPLLETRFIVFP